MDLFFSPEPWGRGPEAGDGHQGRPAEVDLGQLLVVIGPTVEGVGRAGHVDVQQVAIHLEVTRR